MAHRPIHVKNVLYLQYSIVQYSMVWYGMVWYGMVWYGMVWYGIVQYSIDFAVLYIEFTNLSNVDELKRYGIQSVKILDQDQLNGCNHFLIQYSILVQYSMVWYVVQPVVQCSVVQCSVVQCSVVWCGVVQCSVSIVQ